MTAYVINAFGGMVPMASPRLLDTRYATKAVNINLTSGEAKPLRAPLQIGNNILSKAGVKKSIYRFGQDRTELDYWFHWLTDVDVVRGSIADDTTERTYFTGDGVPKYTYSPIAVQGGTTNYPFASFTLGVIKPDLQTLNLSVANRVVNSITFSGTTATATTALAHKLITGSKANTFGATDPLYNGTFVVTVISPTQYSYTMTAAPTANANGILRMNYGGLPESRVYAVSYVSALGEEGAPAITSGFIEVIGGQIVTLNNIPTAPTGNYNYAKKRIYRTATGSVQTTLQFVGEVALAITTFVDDKNGTELGEVIPSLAYVQPPADLSNLIQFSNGMMAGLSGNQCCICVPYQPHAWPIAGRYSFNVKPVALGSFGNSVVVLTEGVPIVLTGSSFDAMSEDKVKVGQPCVSSRSVVELANGVMWASNEGLAFMSNSGFELATKTRFTNREWAQYKPTTIRAYRWVNRYVGFYDTGLKQGGFVFDAFTLDFFELDFYATAGYTDPRNGELYLAIGNNVLKMDAGANLKMEWISKEFESSKPINLAYAKVVASDYPATFNLYADKALKFTKQVANDLPFALPSGYKTSNYKMGVVSQFEVKGFGAAESMEEIKQAVE